MLRKLLVAVGILLAPLPVEERRAAWAKHAKVAK